MFTLNCKGRLWSFRQPQVMGIINCTPDSFYAGSRFSGTDRLLAQAETMIREGAAILDLGGQSTRPGSSLVEADEELKRVIPALEAIHRRFPDTLLSIDSFRSEVAARALEAGASLVNDVSAGSMDPAMPALAAAWRVPYIAMHHRGIPAGGREESYTQITVDLLDYFSKLKDDLRNQGITDLIIDPGFGFGKNSRQNFQLLQQLRILKRVGAPLLAGLSRKSTIYKTLQTEPEKALNGTSVLNSVAILQGADILRVHDVREAVEVIRLLSAMQEA